MTNTILETNLDEEETENQGNYVNFAQGLEPAETPLPLYDSSMTEWAEEEPKNNEEEPKYAQVKLKRPTILNTLPR